MTREIKFRAYNKLTKEMFRVKVLEGRYVWGFDYSQGDNPYEKCHDLEENTKLMQYTGLKDKNGKEIYEGDILKYVEYRSPIDSERESHIGEVKWDLLGDTDGWSHGEYVTWTVKSKSHRESLVDVVNDCEVIGNIWENPELLEAKK